MINGTEKNTVNLVIEKYGVKNAGIFEELVNTRTQTEAFIGLTIEEEMELISAAETKRKQISKMMDEFKAETKKAKSIKAPTAEKTYGKNLCNTRWESLPDSITEKISIDETGRNKKYFIDEGYRIVSGSLRDICWYLDPNGLA